MDDKASKAEDDKQNRHSRFACVLLGWCCSAEATPWLLSSLAYRFVLTVMPVVICWLLGGVTVQQKYLMLTRHTKKMCGNNAAYLTKSSKDADEASEEDVQQKALSLLKGIVARLEEEES